MKKKIGIIGSGFGLYGYLPALIKLKYNKIYTLEKYQNFIKKRKDICKYIKNIIFVKEVSDILKHSEEIIFCRRPIDQEKFLKKNINFQFKKKIYLEKPLSTSSNSSIKSLKRLIKYKIKFDIFYIFLFTNWYKKKFDKIKWYFKSYDISKNIKNWKLDPKKGGGILYFYGIHFLPVVIIKKFNKLKSSIFYKKNNKIFKWKCTFQNKKMNEISIEININSRKKFEIQSNKSIIWRSINPFNKTKFSDDRIPLIIKYLKTNSRQNYIYNFNNKIFNLLKIIEKNTKVFKS